MPGEAAADSPENPCPVRRSGRQAKRTDKLEEFLSTAKRTFRKSAPPSLEGGDPPSQTPTDAETASEASFDGNAEVKGESPERRTRSGARKPAQRKPQSGKKIRSRDEAAVKDEASSGNEEESKDDPTKTLDENKIEAEKDIQNVIDNTNVDPQTEQGCEMKEDENDNDTDETEDEEPEKPAVLVKRGPIRTYVNKKRAAKNTAPAKSSTPVNKVAAPKENKTRTSTICKAQKEEVEESTSTSSSSSSDESDDGGYDPNALYCICRQKHNKRFMICCDRCEEWFHGDCVGITEARGRLMERNGEDYVCPNCTAKKNQVVRPATSALLSGTDKSKAETLATALATAALLSSEKPKENEHIGQASAVSSTAEEKATDDLGIKGRIEKASNPTGKKKIKIFQPQVVQQAAEPKAEKSTAASTAAQKVPSDMEHKVVSNVEVDITATADEQVLEKTEDSVAPKCIGPGCEKNAQPDSVYCGSDCILRHAAAAMKSITEPSQKDKAKPQKSKTKSATDGKKRQKADSDEDYSPDSDEDDEESHAEEQPPHPSTASWSSDHNYIAVTPEKTPSISTVLNKKSPPREDILPEKEQKVKEVQPASEISVSVTPVKPKKKKSSSPPKISKVSPKGKKSSRESSGSKSSKKTIPPPSKSNAKSKKTSQAQQSSPYPAGPIHVTGALRVTKSSFTIPKKQPQQKESQSLSQSSISSSKSSSFSSKDSSSSSSSHHHHHSSSSKHSHSSSPAPPAAPMLPPPNNQMRQNIRRSLTDILYKRVSDSDDLKMTESEVGKLAFAIEREMFNLCLSTDSKYKNKYRSLMLHLKDPKNKGLFYRVIGGEVTPFRLVRLSSEELLSKEISEWRKIDVSESPRSRSRHRHDSTSRSIDMEDAPPTSDADDQEETQTTQSGLATSEGSNMPDIFSSMLKDTTSEHRTHLFDLNCKICTGQKKEEELLAKKDKQAKKETKPSRQEHTSRSGEVSPAPPPQPYHQEAYTYQPTPIVTYEPTPVDRSVPESLPQTYQDDPNLLVPHSVSAPVTPAVSSVTITRRDPRMARHGSGVTVSYSAPEKTANNSTEPLTTPISAPVAPVAPVDVALKGPLPMPPAPPPAAPPPTVAVPKTTKASSEPPPEGETAIFLHSQEKIWKGFINMQNVAKFVTKAYLVSGSFEHLKEDLPDTIHIGGRISPNTVWDYVGKLKTSLSKEICLIRFHPATEEEEVAYVSLYSYFSSRKRFGVVANNNRRIKDLYLIPLSSKDPLPPRLLPFDGPGLEPARPNLLLGLLICQKDRKRAGVPLDTDEKRSKIQSKDTDDTGLQKLVSVAKAEKSIRNSLEISCSTTPPGTPPPISSETPSSTITPSSVLSFLSSVKASAAAVGTGKESPSSSSAIASGASATPLQTILNTLFGKKKHDSEASNSPPDQGGEMSVPPVNILDPIVKQFALSKEKEVVEDDDRPYDPEEEYDPSNGYNVPKNPARLEGTTKVNFQPDTVVGDGDDVAYDPEDESIFDNVKPVVAEQSAPENDCKSEAQKILESLKQTGQQIIQKQEQQTEALSAKPLASSNLLQLGKKVEELVKSASVSPSINQKRDPRQRGDPRHVAEEAQDKDIEDVPAPKEPIPPAPVATVDPESVKSPQEPDKAQCEDTVKTESLPFMESEKDEVSIPLLGEEVVTDMEINYMDSQSKTEEPKQDKAETEDKFSIWPNAATILKSSVEAHYGEDKEDNYYNEPKNSSIMTSAIPVLTQSSTMDSKSHHMSHRIPPSAYDNEYRPPPDIPPQSNFIRPDPMQGQNLHMRPPPMTMPPPIQGPPPMTGLPPMQGPPPPIHIPPPGHGPPPMQGANVQPFGPPSGAYPPFQNQWPSSQPRPQLPPGHQNIMPNRGPPPPFPPVAQRGPLPQMFDSSIRPQHGPPGPPPGLIPPPTFDPQSSIPPPRFSGPPPPFNLPANRGPPPPFTGPPPGHFENRLPPPSHFGAPRGPPPTQFSGHGVPPPSMAEPYKKDSSFTVEPHKPPNTVSMYKDQGPPPSPGFRGPPPNQYEDRRGPPSTGDGSGQHFNPHNQYSSRNRSPPHRGSFEEHRGVPSQESRPTSSQPFTGTERYRFDRLSDEPRPVRHSGSLLPTPSDDSRSSPGRMGAHSPELHREDLWRRESPEVRRRSTSNREDSPRSFSRFEGGHRESSSDTPQLPEERQREIPDERRREREREGPPPGRLSWDRNTTRRFSREQEWERGRERDRSREKDRSRGNEGERPREVEGERHREPEVTEKRRERDRDRDRGREREPDRREREPDRREHDRDRNRNRDRDRERERRRDRSRSRERERGKERTRDRERDRDKDKDRERDRERRDRSRSRERREDRKDYKHDSSRDNDNDKK